jgi:glycosyltransferase involved in cell wall biosynthesis
MKVKRVVHFLCKSVDARSGGMEASMLRIADHLARSPGTRIRIYSLNDKADVVVPPHSKVEVVFLRQGKDLLAEPLQHARDSTNHGAEFSQSTFLTYVCAVRSAMKAATESRHALLSFFASQTGFIAQHVADELGIPHIVSVRGSDFNRDLRDPVRLGAITHVMRRARSIVTTNHAHAGVVRDVFGRRSGVATIHNSVSLPANTPFWKPKRHARVKLFSDSGFSFKKGTHLLLHAVAELRGKGLPVTLTLVGNVEPQAATYWASKQRYYRRACPDTFVFNAWASPEQIVAMMFSSDVYCSASLGEGCSLARLKALTLGLPIVTTRSGEIPDFAGSVPHVYLCEPGDAEGYAAALRAAVEKILAGGIHVPRKNVQAWRRQLRPESERVAWQAVLDQALGRR